MSTGTELSRGTRAAAIVLGTISLLLWMIVALQMSAFGTSDPAGNAMMAGFAGLGLILLWILLSILALITAKKGAIPAWARFAMFLVPVSGVAAVMTLELLVRPATAPAGAMLVPALLPPIIAAYCLWALFARPDAELAKAISALAFGAIAVLSAAAVPLHSMRHATVTQQQHAETSRRAELERLAPDAPLAAHLPFLKDADQRITSDALARIKKLDRRQAEAEELIERDDFPLGQLVWFDLEVTPSLCEKVRAALRKRAEPLVPGAPGTKPYSQVAGDVRDAMSAMYWLTGYGCAVDAESLAWENLARAYRDPGYDVTLLAGMRDPARLGRKLREDPDKISQLGPETHLKAWLKFTDQAETREQVITGARKLDRRTAEAVEILNDMSIESSHHFRLLRILPAIDLEATPALCAAAGKAIAPSIAGVYRPKPPDTPLYYYDLLSRLGVANPLATLVWLAEHGCDVQKTLRDAETAVLAYQDSPGRAAMLATLAKLQKAP
jgi:hypothetical protein